MRKPLRIAVSSVAGASGYGIIQCTQLLPYPVEIYPVDVTPHSVGLYMGTFEGRVLPKPEHNIQAWIDFVQDNQIDALIPGADRDLVAFSNYKDELRAIMSDPYVIEIANDKFQTSLYLDGIVNIDIPDFTIPENAYDWDLFPCIVKPRHGAASRGVQMCKDREEMMFHLHRTENPLIQEYIGGDEVTANVFVNNNGEPVAYLAMLRKDRAGIAIEARPIENENVKEMMYKIGKALQPTGTLSVQMKMIGDKPFPFEINARMSGSSIVRAMAGYNDLDMMIRHYVWGEQIKQPKIDYNQTYFRWYEALAVNSKRVHRLSEERTI